MLTHNDYLQPAQGGHEHVFDTPCIPLLHASSYIPALYYVEGEGLNVIVEGTKDLIMDSLIVFHGPAKVAFLNLVILSARRKPCLS